MAKTPPRLYLFHGNDSRASSQALQRWEERFMSKYGTTSKHTVHADEQSSDQVVRALSEIIRGTNLFSDPVFIILKRVSTQDKGSSTAFSKTVVKALKEVMPFIDESVTLVIWEETALREKHPLYEWFTDLVAQKRAVINEYQVPQVGEMVPMVRAFLEIEGVQLERQAEQWLVEQYRLLEKQARLCKRLRATEQLSVDERSWWLYQLLEYALLHNTGKTITVADLEAGHAALGQSVGVFEIVNAISAGQYARARSLLKTWEQMDNDESAYFGLYALLRLQFRKDHNTHGLRLLAQIEVIVKNFSLAPAWLVDALLLRLEAGDNGALIAPRKLWLAQLQRS